MPVPHAHLYFAYGSNLSEAQMAERCADSSLWRPAVLRGYRLAFGNRSSYRGGGVATVLPSPNGDSVAGLLYRLSEADLAALDRWEAYPKKYGRGAVPVIDDTGETQSALTYFLNDYFPNAPSQAYLDIIRTAYTRFGFDPQPLHEVLPTLEK